MPSRRNNKKKKNTRKSRPQTATYGQPTRVSQPRVPRAPRRDKDALCKAVCGRADPFCEHAIGAKMYDTSSKPTIPYQVKMFHTITSDANGHYAILIPGNPNQAYRVGVVSAGSIVTSWGTNVTIPDYSNMVNLYEQFRIVSFGVRFFCSANTNESKGTTGSITVEEVPTSMDLASDQFVEIIRTPLAGADYTWVSKPTGPQSHSWTDFDVTVDKHNTSLVLSGTGVTASTAIGAMEITVNYELTPIQGTSIVRLATPAAPANPVVETVAANATRSQPSTSLVPHQERSKTFWDFADKALTGLETYGPLLLGMF